MKLFKINSIWKVAIFHLVPGAGICTLYLLMLKVLPFEGVPRQIYLGFAALAGAAVLELGTLLFVTRYEKRSFRDVVNLKNNLKPLQYVLYSLILLLITGALMKLLMPLSERVFYSLFGFIDVSHNYIEDISQFSGPMILFAGITSVLLFTVIVPVIEELYFRGFLMKRMSAKYGAAAPLLNSIFFSVYHLWSPWMLIARTVALLPWFYVVYRKDNIILGIIIHCLANLTDAVVIFVVFFGRY